MDERLRGDKKLKCPDVIYLEIYNLAVAKYILKA